MVQYHAKVMQLLTQFPKYSLINLPRMDNVEADELAKAASEGEGVYKVPLFTQEHPTIEVAELMHIEEQAS